jgi:SH3-like domain-containing protein
MGGMTRRLLVSAALAWALSLAEAAPPLDADALGFFRVVKDADGYVNVRGGPSASAKIQGRVTSGCAVAVYEAKNGWRKLEDDTGADRTLFVHESRLQSLSGWNQVASVVARDKQSALVQSKGFKAVVDAVPFDAKAHTIQRPKPDSEGVLTVDGHRVIGTDGEVPETALTLAVSLHGKPVAVPAEATRDLYQPNLGRAEDVVLITPGDPSDHALVFLWGSDGAGAYAVAWSFVNGAYVGRAVFTGI